jgi:hypothetical protein
MSDWPKVVTCYVHTSKDENYELAGDLGLSEEATKVFKWNCYEVVLQLEVHEDGNAYIHAVNNMLLKEPVRST